jgi:hypothetical protein
MVDTILLVGIYLGISLIVAKLDMIKPYYSRVSPRNLALRVLVFPLIGLAVFLYMIIWDEEP